MGETDETSTQFSKDELNFAISDWNMGATVGGPQGVVDDISLVVGGLPISGSDKTLLLTLVVMILIVNTMGVFAYQNKIQFLDVCGDSHDRTIQRSEKKAAPPVFSGTQATGSPPRAPSAPPAKPPSYEQ